MESCLSEIKYLPSETSASDKYIIWWLVAHVMLTRKMVINGISGVEKFQEFIFPIDNKVETMNNLYSFDFCVFKSLKKKQIKILKA